MAQAFTGDGELKEADIPSAAVLQVAKENLKTNRKTLLQLYQKQTCPTLSSAMPDKAKFHKTLIEYTLGFSMEWVLRLPRSNHDDYKTFCTPGGGGSNARVPFLPLLSLATMTSSVRTSNQVEHTCDGFRTRCFFFLEMRRSQT